jgi:hypothetical protein
MLPSASLGWFCGHSETCRCREIRLHIGGEVPAKAFDQAAIREVLFQSMMSCSGLNQDRCSLTLATRIAGVRVFLVRLDLFSTYID